MVHVLHSLHLTLHVIVFRFHLPLHLAFQFPISSANKSELTTERHKTAITDNIIFFIENLHRIPLYPSTVAVDTTSIEATQTYGPSHHVHASPSVCNNSVT